VAETFRSTDTKLCAVFRNKTSV